VEIGVIAQNHGALYLLDSCQAVGQMVVDVQTIQCDFLSATGRKYLRGPRGTGFLYAKGSVLAEDPRVGEPATLDHHAAPWVATDKYQLQQSAARYEQWESNFAGLVALGTAIDYAMNVMGMEWIERSVQKLAATLRRLLEDCPFIEVHDLGRPNKRCGIVTFSVAELDPLQIKASLLEKQIFVSVTSTSSTRLDFQRRSLPPSMMRASVHYFNSSHEFEALVEALGQLREGREKPSAIQHP